MSWLLHFWVGTPVECMGKFSRGRPRCPGPCHTHRRPRSCSRLLTFNLAQKPFAESASRWKISFSLLSYHFFLKYESLQNSDILWHSGELLCRLKIYTTCYCSLALRFKNSETFKTIIKFLNPISMCPDLLTTVAQFNTDLHRDSTQWTQKVNCLVHGRLSVIQVQEHTKEQLQKNRKRQSLNY